MSLAARISALSTRIAAEIKSLRTEIGAKATLDGLDGAGLSRSGGILDVNFGSGLEIDGFGRIGVRTSGITGDHLDDGAVTDAAIAWGAVNTWHLADGAVVNEKLGAGAVTGTKIADSSVSRAKINVLAVDTARLEFGAVTGPKLGDGAVDLAGTKATGTLPISRGGTGATTAVAARNNLGAAFVRHITLPALSAGTYVDLGVVMSGSQGHSSVSFYEVSGGEEVVLGLRYFGGSISVKSDIPVAAGAIYARVVIGGEV